jgi:ketosteroid isomerase-like protein
MRSILCTVALFAFALTALAQSDPAAVKQALLKADRDFNAATQEHRLDGWMQYFDEDSVIQRSKPVVGKEAIRAELKEQWDNPNFHLTWDPDEAYPMPGGKIGYTRGHWTLTSKDEKGSPEKLTGQYLTIWRMNKQGEWKIIWDGGAADPPPAAKK